jgi:hypothetical protein
MLVALVLGVAATGGTVALVAGSGGRGPHREAAAPRAGSPSPTTAVSSTVAPPPTTVDPGSLPQTPEKPTTTGSAFSARVDALWKAIATDDTSLAMPFFFPLGAYLQVKDLSNPTQDYQQRLVANYVADIHTLHSQLGANAATASFSGIDVPDAQAQWILPGVEFNKGSYWRVYGTTLRYTSGGVARTFTVSSLISWRGEWYVVHLGLIR